MALIQPAPGGSLRVRLDKQEARLLEQLLTELRALLEADIPRVDPVVRRLFPDAHEQEADARAYRELVEDELRAGKQRALRAVEEGLAQTTTKKGLPLAAEEADAWLTTLTDMRLAMGTRLDVTEDTMASDLDPDDPDAPALSVLHWLGWVQEMMVQTMSEPLEDHEP